MSNVIRVYIMDATAKTLKTDDGDCRNIVHKHKDEQPITWELVVDDPQVKTYGFTSDPADPPPIIWDPAPPVPVFKKFKLSADNHTMKVDDKNDKPDTTGTFRYQLSARIDGVLFQTVLTKPLEPADPTLGSFALRDPIIINR